MTSHSDSLAARQPAPGGGSVRTELRWALAATLLVAAAGQTAEAELPVDPVLDAAVAGQEQAAASQRRVEELDDETLELLGAYNDEVARLEDLRIYNTNMRNLLASQAQEVARVEGELEEIEVVRRAIVPLMVEMVDVLERFIELDQPLLLPERRARAAELRTNLTRSDVALAEKYRRLIEAYQIEAEYGQTIEAYEGPIELDGQELTVDFLRVGRLGLYFLSLDRGRGGLWDPESQVWTSLDDSQLDDIDFALRVARKQAPPNLIPLPLWTRQSP